LSTPFITFEGIDGAGKSTQVQSLARLFRKMNRDPLVTREPGGSAGAEDIRRLLVAGDQGRWSVETEILLFTAARRDHLERSIQPALKAGRTVISDRFADSTRVYQGAARASTRRVVDRLHSLMIGREPDLTFIIDLDPAIALSRRRVPRADRFENMGLDFQKAVRTGFLALAEEFPDRCVVVNGDDSPEKVATDVSDVIGERCP